MADITIQSHPKQDSSNNRISALSDVSRIEVQPTPVYTGGNKPSGILQRAKRSSSVVSSMELLTLQRAIGNHAVVQLMRGVTQRTQVPSRFVQRSWVEDQVNLVRTAISAGNWADSNPPGAYYVLNGLSTDDMVKILRALSAADRKKLSDNLDEHAGGFDRARLQLGLTNAATATGSTFFGDLSEKIHWAIRSQKFVEYPDGAFWIINPLNEQDTAKIMTFLGRDHLDELIANRENAIAAGIPNALRIVREANKARETHGATAQEKSIANLIAGPQKVGSYEVATVEADCREAFKALNSLNDIDLLRAIRALPSDKRFTLEMNIDQVDGLAVAGNRIRHFLRLADNTADQLRASTITDMTWQLDYKKPPGDYSHTLQVSPPWNLNTSFDLVIEEISDDELPPDAVDQIWKDAAIGRGGMLWPSKLNKSTVPKLWHMKQTVLKQIADWHGQDMLFIIQSFLAVEFVLHMGASITAPQMTTRPRRAGGMGGHSRPPTSTPEPSPNSTQARARELAKQIADEGHPVIANIGGAGAKHEPANAINVNNQAVARKGIPNLVEADGSDIGDLFEPATLDRIEGHNMAPGVVNWSRAAPGAYKTLKPGGKLDYAFRGSDPADAKFAAEQLRQAGFKGVKIIGEDIPPPVGPAYAGVQATKP